MESTVELSKILVQLDQDAFKALDGDIFFIEGLLPILHIPYKLALVTADWNHQTEDDSLVTIRLMSVGETVDPQWAITTRLQWLLKLRCLGHLVKWSEDNLGFVEDISLGEESVIYIDDHQWNLIPTINKYLAESSERLPGLISDFLQPIIANSSRKYFNSDLIPAILEKLYYRVSRSVEDSIDSLHLTAYSVPGSWEASESSSYSYFQLPTADIAFFINHFVKPKIEIKGYQLVFGSLKVIGDNQLIISLKETTNDWNIEMEVFFVLQENALHPTIHKLEVDGLNVLKRAMFKLFKAFLIRQIESRPIPLDKLYSDLMKKIAPYVRLMPGCGVRFEKWQMTPESMDLLIVWTGTDKGSSGLIL